MAASHSRLWTMTPVDSRAAPRTTSARCSRAWFHIPCRVGCHTASCRRIWTMSAKPRLDPWAVPNHLRLGPHAHGVLHFFRGSVFFCTLAELAASTLTQDDVVPHVPDAICRRSLASKTGRVDGVEPKWLKRKWCKVLFME